MEHTKNIKALILAAGDGKRMRADTPKPLVELWHKPLIGYVLDTLKSCGIKDIGVIVSSSEKGKQVAAYVRHMGAKTFTQSNPLGTAHAVLSAGKYIEDKQTDYLVLCADSPLLDAETLLPLLKAAPLQEKQASSYLAMEMLKDKHSFGVLYQNDLNHITNIIEASEQKKHSDSLTDLCNSGVCLFNGSYFADIVKKIGNSNTKKEYFLTDFPAIAHKAGLINLTTIAQDGYTLLGVNTPEELTHAGNLLQQRWRRYHMNNGVYLAAPDTVFFSHDTKLAPGCVLEPNIVFGPQVTIHKGSRILAFSHVEGATIQTGSTVGPFARLRPGTQLDKNVKVGNFVEIKKSHLQEGTKVSHLSYIGDAVLESNVNIGAGTITCNYDGVNKHKTHIEQGAFIGSNSSLVAPVTIGQGALVGAGSVITKDVPKDSLSLTRSRQKNIAEYQHPAKKR